MPERGRGPYDEPLGDDSGPDGWYRDGWYGDSRYPDNRYPDPEPRGHGHPVPGFEEVPVRGVPARPEPRRAPYPGPPRPRPRPRPVSAARRRFTVAARAMVCAASGMVLLASGVTWAVYRDLTTGMTTSRALNVVRPGERGYIAPRLDGSVNLLLIGLDSRKDMDGNDLPTDFVESQLHAGSSDIGGYNTNVLILLHIPADGGQVTAFSIARDDYVEEPGGDSSVGPIPDLGMHKIKEAYGRAKYVAERRIKAAGETDKAKIEAQSREVGRESTIRAVQLLTGEHVDHLAEINLLGFYDIAQAVGPIQVCLNHPVYDPIEDGAGTGLRLPAGYSTLDAATALQFVRQRFHLQRGDFDRNRRQQAFLSAVLAKLRDEGVVGDLGRMRALFDVVKKDLVIDDDWDVLDFAGRAQNLTGGNAVFNELPITGQPVLPGDGSVNTVNPSQIRKIVMTAFGDGAAYVPDDPSAPGPTDLGNVGNPVDGSTPTAPPSPNPNTPTNPSTSASASTSTSPYTAPAPGPATIPPTAPAVSIGDAAFVVRHRHPAEPTTAASLPDGMALVDLYNATARHGAAGPAAEALSAAGWPVDRLGTAAAQDRSAIYFGPGAEQAAGRLAALLGLTAVPEARSRTTANHVQVYLGSDYGPPPAADPAPSPADPGRSGGPDPAAPGPGAAATPPAIVASNGVTCVN